MLTFQKLKGLFKQTQEDYLKSFLGKFFYRIARSVAATQIKLHGRLIAASYDFVSVIVSCLFAVVIFANALPSININSILSGLMLILIPQVALFRLFGLYRGFWRFASIQDLRKILFVSILGGVIVWVILQTNLFETVTHKQFAALPDSIVAMLYGVFLAGLLSVARLVVRMTKNYKHRYGDYQRVIIVGAGNAGEGLARDLLRGDSHRYKPIVFVDDDLRKLGREIHGIRVAGTIVDLPKLISKHGIDLVLIAIPSASSASMRSVVSTCEKANVPCHTLPGIKDLANGRVSINILRNISLEDLIGRYPVTCQWDAIKENLQDSTILITGGGGSIGSELCRQVAGLGCVARLVIIDCNEYNLYNIDMELRQKFPTCTVIPILLSITDRVGIKAALNTYQPRLVFHAAAYKHVPMLEDQPRIAMHNNIIGTAILAEEAIEANVEKFVLISSDKAVNPTNIMGATKRAAEYFCQNLNDAANKTRFITVRFGNVLDSAGSVIPLFRKQIEAGGPVTVTHPEITRFFMTIPEASQLILHAANLGQGGEIFVLDMGDPIKINYLAEQMIKLSGKVVNKDIKIIYTGLRPGEKLYEECFYSSEMLQQTTHPKILSAQCQRHNFQEIQRICDQIERACQSSDSEKNKLVKLLKQLVPEYQPSHEVIDMPLPAKDTAFLSAALS